MSGFDPKALARVAIAAAGTPQAIKSSGFIVRSYTIQADPANAGPYFYVKDAAGNIMGKISPGQSYTPPQLPSAGTDLSQVQLDADTTGDGGFVAYI